MNSFNMPAGGSNFLGNYYNQMLSKVYARPMAQQAPMQQQKPQMPMAQAPQPAFQNDFVYKRPTFGMQRQMTGRPSMQWRLGN